MRLAVPLCLCLAACGDWPVVDAPTERKAAWPELRPISELVEAGVITEARDEDAASLAARAAALRNRARILRGRANSSADMEALRARLIR